MEPCQLVAEVKKIIISSEILFGASILIAQCPLLPSAFLHPHREVERGSSKKIFDDAYACNAPSRAVSHCQSMLVA